MYICVSLDPVVKEQSHTNTDGTIVSSGSNTPRWEQVSLLLEQVLFLLLFIYYFSIHILKNLLFSESVESVFILVEFFILYILI